MNCYTRQIVAIFLFINVGALSAMDLEGKRLVDIPFAADNNHAAPPAEKVELFRQAAGDIPDGFPVEGCLGKILAFAPNITDEQLKIIAPKLVQEEKVGFSPYRLPSLRVRNEGNFIVDEAAIHDQAVLCGLIYGPNFTDEQYNQLGGLKVKPIEDKVAIFKEAYHGDKKSDAELRAMVEQIITWLPDISDAELKKVAPSMLSGKPVEDIADARFEELKSRSDGDKTVGGSKAVLCALIYGHNFTDEQFNSRAGIKLTPKNPWIPALITKHKEAFAIGGGAGFVLSGTALAYCIYKYVQLSNKLNDETLSNIDRSQIEDDRAKYKILIGAAGLTALISGVACGAGAYEWWNAHKAAATT